MNNKWNCIGDLKPEPDETYIVTVAENCNGDPMVRMMYYEGSHDWINLRDGSITRMKVTHWMNKPDLPEGIY